MQIYVKPHQCRSHQSILLTQGPICEIFAKNVWELAILKISLFLSRPFWNFFSWKKKFASIPWKSVQIYMVEWMVSRKLIAMRNTYYIIQCNLENHNFPYHQLSIISLSIHFKFLINYKPWLEIIQNYLKSRLFCVLS